MTEPIQARHLDNAELELLGEKVTQEGGELRLLSGSDHGLVVSVMYSRVTPGSGPPPPSSARRDIRPARRPGTL